MPDNVLEVHNTAIRLRRMDIPHTTVRSCSVQWLNGTFCFGLVFWAAELIYTVCHRAGAFEYHRSPGKLSERHSFCDQWSISPLIHASARCCLAHYEEDDLPELLVQ